MSLFTMWERSEDKINDLLLFLKLFSPKFCSEMLCTSFERAFKTSIWVLLAIQ